MRFVAHPFFAIISNWQSSLEKARPLLLRKPEFPTEAHQRFIEELRTETRPNVLVAHIRLYASACSSEELPLEAYLRALYSIIPDERSLIYRIDMYEAEFERKKATLEDFLGYIEERDLARATLAAEQLIRHASADRKSKPFFHASMTIFGYLGRLSFVHDLFDEMNCHGLRRTTRSYNALIFAHAKHRDFGGSLRAFADLCANVDGHGAKPDIYSYHGLLEAFVRHVHLSISNAKEELLENGFVKLDDPLFLTLLEERIDRTDISTGIDIFRQIIAKRIEPNLRTYTYMIMLAASTHNVDLARWMFDRMTMTKNIAPDSKACGLLVSAYARVGRTAEAATLFTKLEEAFGIAQEREAFKALMKAHVRDKNLKAVLQLVMLMEDRGIALDGEVYVLWMEALLNGGRQADAKALFDRMQETKIKLDVNICNSYMNGLLVSASYTELLEVYTKMIDNDVRPNQYSISLKIFAYTALEDGKGLVDFYETLVSQDFELGKKSRSALLQGFIRLGQIKAMEKLLGQTKVDSLIREYSPLASLIHALYKLGNLEGMLTILEELETQHHSVDINVYNLALHLLLKRKAVEYLPGLLAGIAKSGMGYNSLTFILLLHIYAKAGDVASFERLWTLVAEDSSRLSAMHFRARLIFERNTGGNLDLVFSEARRLQVQPDLICYNILLTEYVKREGSPPSKVQGLLDDMSKDGIRPDLITFNLLLQGCVRNKTMSIQEIWHRMEEEMVAPNQITYAFLIQHALSSRDISRAESLLAQMQARSISVDPSIVTILIQAHLQTSVMPGDGGHLAAQQLMQVNTLTKISTRLCNVWLAYFERIGGQIEQARAVWHEMRRRGINPDEHTWRYLRNIPDLDDIKGDRAIQLLQEEQKIDDKIK